MARAMAPRGSSTGCLTCRIRRVKCDESRPSCRKCSSTGRKCDGYCSLGFSRTELKAASQRSALTCNSTSPTLVELIPTLIRDETFRDATEKRYFQFFRFCTVVDTNLTTDSRFWDRIVLQASHAEPAIKHAILALGSYHNFTTQDNTCHAAIHHLRYADEQYLKALSEAKILLAKSSSRQVERVLIVCILFILYEGMRGNYAISQAHMDNARAIAAETRKKHPSLASRKRLAAIGDTLARMDVLALSFSESTSPYHYTLHDFLQTTPDLDPPTLQDLDHARASLIDIVRWMLVTGFDPAAEAFTYSALNVKYGTAPPGKLGRRLRLETWRRQWDDLKLAQPHLNCTLPALNIELWYVVAKINVDADLHGPETRFDCSLDDFQRAVDIGEKISSALANKRSVASFGLDVGYIFPMFFAAIRCRDPCVRRHMMDILRRHRRRESTWQSIAAAAVAQRWMEAEEEGLEGVHVAADVPDANRISTLDIKVDVKTHTATLHFQSPFRDFYVNDFSLPVNDLTRRSMNGKKYDHWNGARKAERTTHAL